MPRIPSRIECARLIVADFEETFPRSPIGQSSFFRSLDDGCHIHIKVLSKISVIDAAKQYTSRIRLSPSREDYALVKDVLTTILKDTKDYHASLNYNVERLRSSSGLELMGLRNAGHIWHDLENELSGTSHAMRDTLPIEAFQFEVRQFTSGLNRLLSNWNERYSITASRPTNEALVDFIYYLTDIYVEAGGELGAECDATRKEFRKRFNLFVISIFKVLPENVQAHSSEALRKRIQRVLQEREDGGSQSVLTMFQNAQSR